MDVFGPASHDEVLQLVVQISALLLAARGLGWVAQRLGQPTVVGEILAGVVLGPSLLSTLVPAIGKWIVPQTETQGHLLEVVGLIGVMLLLIVTGLETDLGLIRRRIRVAAGVAIGGLLVPFATGVALGFAIPDSLLGDPSNRTVFVLFLATALSISAIPVLAKILIDLDLMRREFGQTVLAAGMIDDITGWTMLGLVTALASAEALTAGTVTQVALMVVLFLAVTATVGRVIVDRSLSLVQDRIRGPDSILTLVIVLAFAWGAFSQALRLEPVIGAFAVGILFGRLPRLPAETVAKLESMTLAVFAPIFFGIAGLKVDLVAVLEPELLLLTLVVIGVATFGKVVGAYLGARLISRQDHWSALAYGAGLNARGAVEIIIATIGLTLGVLSQEMFSIIVIMAMATSLMAPFALRWALARVKPGEEEEYRLAKQDLLKGSFVSTVRRVLVPVRPRPTRAGAQIVQSFVVSRLAAHSPVATTILAVASNSEERSVATEYLRSLEKVFDVGGTTTRLVRDDDPVQVVLRESDGGYDLMLIATPALADSGPELFGPVIDDLIRLSPCPTIVVRGGDVPEGWSPRRIVVPIDGSPSSRNAADLALAIAGSGVVRGVHVSVPTLSVTRFQLGDDITSELEQTALSLGQAIETTVREDEDVASGVLAELHDREADLLILGTSVRAGTTRLFLGPRVEHLLREAPCPVMVLNT